MKFAWTESAMLREVLPDQAQYEDGWYVGYRDWSDFRQRREFSFDSPQPSDAWKAGYRAGYDQAERSIR